LSKASAWTLLVAFALYLGAPSLALCRPVPIALCPGTSSSGDPVGGERHDDRDIGGDYPVVGIDGECEFFSRTPPRIPSGRSGLQMPVFLLPLAGVLGGTTYTLFMYPTYWVSSRVR
jgi:hypothetical protein